MNAIERAELAVCDPKKMRVPILACLYGGLMTFVMFWSIHSGLKQHRPIWYVTLSFVESLATLVIFTGYWMPEIIRPFGPIALSIMLVSLLWTIFDTGTRLPELDQPDFSEEQNRFGRIIWATIILIFLFPIYWFGGIAAFKAL